MRLFRFVVVFVVASFALGALASGSGFHKSTLKVIKLPALGGPQDIATGKVTSDTAACVPHRTVKVFSYAKHRMLMFTDSDQTNSNGKWTAKAQAKHGGRIKAKLTPGKIGQVGNRSTCRGDTVITDLPDKRAKRSAAEVPTIIAVEKPIKQSARKILVTGRIHSHTAACKNNRRVEFSGAGNFPDDVDHTSRQGAFAGVIFVKASDPWGVFVKGKTIGPPGDRTTCKRANYLSD